MKRLFAIAMLLSTACTLDSQGTGEDTPAVWRTDCHRHSGDARIDVRCSSGCCLESDERFWCADPAEYPELCSDG